MSDGDDQTNKDWPNDTRGRLGVVRRKSDGALAEVIGYGDDGTMTIRFGAAGSRNSAPGVRLIAKADRRDFDVVEQTRIVVPPHDDNTGASCRSVPAESREWLEKHDCCHLCNDLGKEGCNCNAIIRVMGSFDGDMENAMAEDPYMDLDEITLLDVDGNVILQFYRHIGRRKVYVMSPTVSSTSLPEEQARELAMWIIDTLDGLTTAQRSALTDELEAAVARVKKGN